MIGFLFVYSFIVAWLPVLAIDFKITNYGLAKWFDMRWVIPFQFHGGVLLIILYPYSG